MTNNENNILFQINHPAHFHLFKNTINELKIRGNEVIISMRDKDILKQLLKDHEYVILSEKYRKSTLFSIMSNVLKRDKKLLKLIRQRTPQLMAGTSPEIGHIRSFTKTPAIFFGEDDVNLSNRMYAAAASCYPFFDVILSPAGVNNGIWNNKTIFYDGYQKLAYLHPNYFKADRNKVEIPQNEKYFILRFSGLGAYHDNIAEGIGNSLANRIIKKLKNKGKIIISSERELPTELEQYRFKGNIHHIHHYLYFADMYIGDSQSMSVESALLGTPGIRYSSLVGKISVLEDLEHKYNLTLGVKPSEEDKLFDVIDSITNNPNATTDFKQKKDKLISEKIDVTAFFTWFLSNYPNSAVIMRKDPDYQYNFK
jgi:predicted glycosyltransferase